MTTSKFSVSKRCFSEQFEFGFWLLGCPKSISLQTFCLIQVFNNISSSSSVSKQRGLKLNFEYFKDDEKENNISSSSSSSSSNNNNNNNTCFTCNSKLDIVF